MIELIKKFLDNLYQNNNDRFVYTRRRNPNVRYYYIFLFLFFFQIITFY